MNRGQKHPSNFDKPKGPIIEGSPLYRLLELVALRVAKRLTSDSSPRIPVRKKSKRNPPCTP